MDTESRNCQHQSCTFFFFNDAATTEIYTLSLHDALPIYTSVDHFDISSDVNSDDESVVPHAIHKDRKSTRLNSSHW